MSQVNAFEFMVRNKVRFTEVGGNLSAEDVLDLPLEGADKNLDALAISLYEQIQAAGRKSFVNEAGVSPVLQAKFDFVKQIIDEKKEAKAKAKEDAVRKAKLAQVDQAIARKQAQEIDETSLDDLIKQREELAK